MKKRMTLILEKVKKEEFGRRGIAYLGGRIKFEDAIIGNGMIVIKSKR